MKKRLIAPILALALVATLLVGCGSSAASTGGGSSVVPAASTAEPPAETVTIRFWGGIQPEMGPDRVVENFNAAFADKGIQVEYERYVNDDQGNLKLETSLLAGNEVDVFVSYGNERLQKRVEAGMALNLTELMERDGFDYPGLFGESVEGMYINGSPYSISTVLSKGSLLVNKDMFDAAGIELPTSWTFEEFREVCAQLTSGEGQDKVYGMFWNTQQNISEYWLCLAKQSLGGDAVYKDGNDSETNFDNPIVQASAQLVYDTMQDGSAPTHVDSVTQQLTMESMFLNGRAAMVVGNWIIRNVKDTTEYPHDFVTAYVPYPVVNESEANYLYGNLGDHVLINPKSDNIDAAWEFLKWYSTEGMLPMASGGRIPLSTTISSDDISAEFFTGYEHLIDVDTAVQTLFSSADDKLATATVTTSLSEITAVLNEEVEAYFTGTKTLEVAFADAKQRADALLA